MFEYVLNFLLYLLAVYGLICLISNITDLVCGKVNKQNVKACLVLIVKNQEETIEGLVRTIYEGNHFRKIIYGGKLVILDMGSNDQTLEILGRLKTEYEAIEILREEEKDKLFTYFDKYSSLEVAGCHLS